MANLLYRIGSFAAGRRGVVVVTWLAVLGIAVGAFTFAGAAPNGEISIPGTPTAQVTERLSQVFPAAAGGSGSVVFHTEDGTSLTDAQRAEVGDRIAQAATIAGIENVLDPFATQADREAQEAQIADGRIQLDDAKAQLVDGQAQIDDAKAQLIDGQAQLDEGQATIVDGQADLDEGRQKLIDGQEKLDAGRRQVRDGQRQLDAARAQVADGQAELDAGRRQLFDGQRQLDAAKAQIADGQAQLDAGLAQIKAGQAQLDAGRAQLADQQAQLDAARAQAEQDGTLPEQEAMLAAWQAQLDAGNAQLDTEQAGIDAGRAHLAAKQQELNAGKATIAEKQQELNAGKAKLAAGQRELDAGKATIAEKQQELNAGKAKLDRGQRKLDAGMAKLVEGQRELDEGQATVVEKQAEIDEGWATIAQNQEELDAAPSKLATETARLEAGARLIELAAGIRLVSDDGSAAISSVSFTDPQTEVEPATLDALVATFEDDPIDGVAVDFSASIASELPSLVGPTEAIGLVVAGIVLMIMLGTVVAAGLPILTALIGVAIATLGALALSSVVPMTSVTPVLGVMLGLAVGIDYALFIVNRHRKQLMEGYTTAESIALANGTSGNAVVFAGSTVVIALLALNVTGIPFLGLMGTIGAASVTIAVLIATTLTPALLSFAGTRVLRRREADRIEAHTRPAAPTARPMSMGSAVGRVLVGVVALAILAVPAFSMRLGLPVGSSEAPDTTQYRAYTTTADAFGDGQNGTLLVVAELPAPPTEDGLLDVQVQVAERIAAFDDVVAVAPVLTSDARSLIGFQVVPAEGPTSVSTERLVADLRAASPLPGGISIGVAGQTSAAIDISAKLAAALPLYLAVVLGLSLLIMVVVFRSLLVPLIATGGFALSLFAAMGGVVAIYQWGWLGGLFGVTNPGPILNFLPTMLAGILFGLAMDYTLFLASGMREAYAHGAPARTAVVLGFRAGRAVVTAAAIIMVAVFGGFIFSESAIVRPLGFALAFGVLVDAFVVRMLVMPAMLHLLGEKAWWLPAWLDRLIPNVDVEGAALERRHPHADVGHAADAPTALVPGTAPAT